ncbi:MAG: SDR family oxidoreductase [Bacteroidia bacterium]
MQIRLDDKVILITGGGTGLGKAMAQTLIQCGAKVIVCGRRETPLQQTSQQLGPACSYHVCDVRNYEEVKQMLQKILDSHHRLDAAINNAAGNFLCASEDLTPNGFRAIVDIVLQGTFNVSQLVGSYWITHQMPGHILNIVTTYTDTGNAFVLPSAAAKAGVQALTLSLAYEWASYGIRVNAIAPGPFPTEGAWSRLMPPELEEAYKKKIPAGRYGNPKELGALAAFLLSDLAPYITGAVIPIDGAERLARAQFNYLSEIADRNQLKTFFAALRPKK